MAQNINFDIKLIYSRTEIRNNAQTTMYMPTEFPHFIGLLLPILLLSCLFDQSQAVSKLSKGDMDKIRVEGFEGFIDGTKKSAVLLEFYSEMCGSCKVFTPKLNALHKKIIDDKEDLAVYKVNIDDKEGMQLATDQNALEDGIPNLRLYFVNKLS